MTLAEAKRNMYVDHSDDDGLIEGLIEAAFSHVDGWHGCLGRAVTEQTWELVLDTFPGGTANAAAIELPLGPLVSVTSIKYDDTDGAEQTVNSDDYIVDTVANPGWVVPIASWPTTATTANAVRVRFVAGMSPDADGVPRSIKQAMLLIVGSWYANRESVTAEKLSELPYSASASSLLSLHARKTI